jgi:hypothetical protein
MAEATIRLDLFDMVLFDMASLLILEEGPPWPRKYSPLNKAYQHESTA